MIVPYRIVFSDLSKILFCDHCTFIELLVYFFSNYIQLCNLHLKSKTFSCIALHKNIFDHWLTRFYILICLSIFLIKDPKNSNFFNILYLLFLFSLFSIFTGIFLFSLLRIHIYFLHFS